MIGFPYLRLRSAYQALDSDLTSIATLGTAANKMLYTTGANIWVEAALTSAGRAILDDANVAAQKTTLGVGANDSPTFTGLILVGNDATLKIEDNSGNYSIIKSGNSQLTISADPDNAVASTDIVFKIDGTEVGRFQQGLGFQSVKGFATQLWDVAGANWETAAINTEYYSPNQCGGIYGIIYRQYFNAVLTSTNPRLDTGNTVTKMVDYVLHSKYTTADRGLGHGNMTAYGSSDNHAYLMLSGASGGGNLSFGLTGYTVITGWVDYTR